MDGRSISDGDSLANGRGERLTFVSLPTDPERDPLVVEVAYRPGGAPPDHRHPEQHERFEVLSGALEVTIAGASRQRNAGAVFEVAPATVHTMRAVGDDTRVRWTITPALGTERFFRSTWALDAAAGGRGRSDLLRLAQVLHAHRREFRLARPGEPFQGVLVGFLAGIGRLLGRRLEVR